MDLTGRVVDFSDDEDSALVKQAAHAGRLPAYVQEAMVPDEASSYAYVGRDIEGRLVRKFALDTKPQTWLSMAYFLKHGHVFPKNEQRKIASNIRAACHLFGIAPAGLLEKAAAGSDHLVQDIENAVLPSESYAHFRPGETPRWPIHTPEQVKQACTYFEDNWRFMEPADRRDFSQRVMRRAAVLDGELEKEAGRIAFRPGGPGAAAYGTGKAAATGRTFAFTPPKAPKAPKAPPAPKAGMPKTPKAGMPKAPPAAPAAPVRKLGEEIPDRMRRYAGEDLSELMPYAFKDRFARLDQKTQKWAALEVLWDNRGAYTLEKMAQALESFDREAGFDRLWDTKLPDPYLSVFGFAKQADGDQVIYDSNGLLVTGTMLRNLSPEKLASIFDRDFAQQFKANPVTIFQSLPAPDKQVIAEAAVGTSQDTEAHTYPGSMSVGKAL